MDAFPFHPFASLIEEDIEAHDLIAAGDQVIVAVSGGPDSVALTLALKDLRVERDFQLELAHVNHGLRGGESDGDERFVRDLAADLRLNLTVTRHDVKKERRRGESIESAARRIRYTDIAELAELSGAASVAVGHTRDDQVETILLRLLRGSRISDLGGMAWSRPIRSGSHVNVIRPMLDTDRAAVEAFLEASGIECRQDSSNLDRSYVRNRIRHDLLPLLEAEYSPAIREFLIRLGDVGQSCRLDEVVQAHALLDEAERAEESVRVPVRLFAAAKPSVREAFLREAIGVLLDAPALSAEGARRAAVLIEAEGSSTWVPLGGGLRARRVYDKIVIERQSGTQKRFKDTVPLAAGGRTEVPDLGVAIEVRRAGKGTRYPDVKVPGTFSVPRERPADLRVGPRVALLDADRLQGDLFVRTRRPGDRFHPLGAPGERKLKDLFIDRKVPAADRDRIPLVCDDAGIVWVVGHTIADRVKVTDATTRLLRLRVTRLRGPTA